MKTPLEPYLLCIIVAMVITIVICALQIRHSLRTIEAQDRLVKLLTAQVRSTEAYSDVQAGIIKTQNEVIETQQTALDRRSHAFFKPKANAS